jgi:hypothetical protein
MKSPVDAVRAAIVAEQRAEKMSGKNDHINIPPAENQVEIILAIKRAAAKVYDLSPRTVDSKGRPVGTKTVVFGRKVTPRELDIILYLGYYDELKTRGSKSN